MAVHGGGGDTTPFLPDEIIENILMRLPVKTLIQFHCVSKHWQNLLKSPSFISDHLHHIGNQNPNPSSLVFQQPWILFVTDCEMRGLDVRMTSKFWSISIIGTCNGLVCVRSGTYLFLWNPSTREVRRVPGVIHNDKDGFFYFGFGFSPVVNDYKIVKIFRCSSVIKPVEVYSLNTDSWREIETGNALNGVKVFFPNTSADGYIFWKSGKGRDGVISFDIAMEVFTHVQIPVPSIGFTVIVQDGKPVLISLDGRFCWWVMDAHVKKWGWMNIDTSKPSLSHLHAKISALWPIDHVCLLFYVESLVPVSKHS